MREQASTDHIGLSGEAVQSTRRSFMHALGLAGTATMLGTASGSTTATSDTDYESFEFGGDRLILGGQRIVGTGGYDTIKAAWADAESGDTIVVHSSYDAQAAGESFPITLDYDEKEVMLTGGHPSGSVIDAGPSDANVIEVIGRGMNDYRNNPMVQNLKIVGGDVGLRVRAAPFSKYQNLVFYRNGSHGAVVDGYTDPETGTEKGSHGVRFENCQAWSCGGSGFRVESDALAHGTTFDECVVTWCGGGGSGTASPAVMLRGYSSQWQNGIVQGNAGFAIDVRRGGSQGIHSTYFEGNGRLREYPIDIYAGGSSELLVENCYFYGHFASGPFTADAPEDRTMRAINFHGTQGATVRNCTFRDYGHCFVRTQGGAHEIDVNCASHYALDDTTFLSRTSSSDRIRDAGVIMETDLRQDAEQGQFVGDRGIHDGSGSAPWGLALWNGNRWVSVMDGSKL